MLKKDIYFRNLKAKDKQYKAYDADGLFMIVTPGGHKWWRFKYTFAGMAKTLSLGTYPLVSLKDARAKRDELKACIVEGIDPSQERKNLKIEAVREQAQAQNTFEKISREWIGKHDEWSDKHRQTIVSRLEKYIFPVIGNKPMAELERADIMAALRPIEARGTLELAKRIGRVCAQITDYASSCGYARFDFAAGIAKGLKTAAKQNFAAITDPAEFGRLLLTLGGYAGEVSTCHCLKLLPHVFVRSGEIRGMKWAEIDFVKALWTIPAERMKMRRPHIVPLSRQSMSILDSMKRFSGNNLLVFPSALSKTRPLSDMTLLNALRRLGYERGTMTVHGFRSSASTLLNELGYNRDWIELQLAHCDKNSIRGIYNRAQYLEERRKMMQEWSDYLDGLKAQAQLNSA